MLAKRKYSEYEKKLIKQAQDSWNDQCTAFIRCKKPFIDRNLKECLERHGVK